VQNSVRAKLGSAPPVAAAEVGQTNNISITATTPNPVRSAMVANLYAKAFVSYRQSVNSRNLAAAEFQLRSQISATARQIKALGSRSRSSAQVIALSNQESVLKEQLAQLQVSGAVNSGGVEFVTPAQASVASVSPRPARDALLGLLAGLILGLGAAFLAEHLDDRLTTTEMAERAAQAPVLGAVPLIASWRRPETPLLISKTDPASPVTESYRSLRTSVQFARQESSLRCLLVTSPAASEGKTSTVANLGVVFTQAAERVLLVSCDLRKPRLGDFFGIDESRGITSVLTGQDDLDDVLRPVPGGNGQLWLLPAGPAVPDPAELLGWPRTADLFRTLIERFDLVLADSPPVLAVTDAAVLSRVVDGTVVVTAAGKTRKTELRRAAQRLQQLHVPVLGVILNQANRQAGYGYGYGYGYGAKDGGQAGPAVPAPVMAAAGEPAADQAASGVVTVQASQASLPADS